MYVVNLIQLYINEGCISMLKQYRRIKRIIARQNKTNAEKMLLTLSGVTNYGLEKVKISHSNYYIDRVNEIIDSNLIITMKYNDLDLFKRDLATALMNYHNITFKAIIRLYVFEKVAINDIATKYNINRSTVRQIVDISFKQICREYDNRTDEEITNKVLFYLCSSNVSDTVINKVDDFIKGLEAYDYDCIINCQRDLVLNLKEVAIIHNKSIREILENIEVVGNRLLQHIDKE